MRPVLPAQLQIDQARIGLVHEFGGLEGVVGTLIPHVEACQAAQLVIQIARSLVDARTCIKHHDQRVGLTGGLKGQLLAFLTGCLVSPWRVDDRAQARIPGLQLAGGSRDRAYLCLGLLGQEKGVKEGRRFLDLLNRSDGMKPVVLFKGGRTKAGSRAVTSHTASMGGEEVLWEAICRQHGVVRVHSMHEMSDLLLAFQFLRPSTGRRVLVMGGGGGGSVAAADVCEIEGFEVPPLPSEMRDAIRSFAPEVWSLISNPMDGSVMGGIETMVRCFQMGSQWDSIDLLIGNSSAIWLLDHKDNAKQHELSIQFLIELSRESQKPMVIYINAGDTTTPWRVEARLMAQERCREAGIPVYPNIQRAARALANFTSYHRRRANLQQKSPDL